MFIRKKFLLCLLRLSHCRPRITHLGIEIEGKGEEEEKENISSASIPETLIFFSPRVKNFTLFLIGTWKWREKKASRWKIWSEVTKEVFLWLTNQKN